MKSLLKLCNEVNELPKLCCLCTFPQIRLHNGMHNSLKEAHLQVLVCVCQMKEGKSSLTPK